MKNILLASIVLVAGGFSNSAKADFEMTCESSAGQTRNCPISGTYNQIFLKTQLSRAACYEGSSWGVDDAYLWVSNGCRAIFRVDQGNTNYNSYGNRYESHESSNNGKAAAAAVAVIIGAAAVAAANKNNSHGSYSHDDYSNRYSNSYDNDYGSRDITCESRDGKRSQCTAHIGRGSVQISRKLSNSACRFGEDWDYDRNAIYVWNGCRAVFKIY